MSVFRPTRRVAAPDGREWEIYAYKIKMRSPRPYDPSPWPSPGGVLLEAFFWFVLLIPRLLVRIADVALAAVSSVRSDEWTIEAICFVPRESFTWRTTREFKGQVLARVEGSLARGDVPTRLTNATLVDWGRPR